MRKKRRLGFLKLQILKTVFQSLDEKLFPVEV
uniref:Uncharacterized protein n=1 Tax=Rhizophora mucronata TaxID=61149 RepID=A0A2P2NGC3_RHIMU